MIDEKGAPAWQAGDPLPAHTLEPVTRLKLIKYAGASGDYNPIHTIDQAAADAGLAGVIQHGMLSMAELGHLFSPYQGAGYVRRFETRFTGMVFVGDALTVGGTVTGVEHLAEGTAYLCDVRAANQKGQTIATGRVMFLVPSGH
jgi:acyl dehydratase